MFHPATLLVAWFAYVLALQWLAPQALYLLALAVAVLAAGLAADRSLILLKRSRWLLLALGVIYLLATPGVYLPGIAGKLGLSFEGVEQGFVQIIRLVALLLSLAILHQWIGREGMLQGLHWILRRFSWGRATVVRLMLALDYVEGKGKIAWRDWLIPGTDTNGGSGEADRFFLVQTPVRWVDVFAVFVAYSILALLVVRT